MTEFPPLHPLVITSLVLGIGAALAASGKYLLNSGMKIGERVGEDRAEHGAVKEMKSEFLRQIEKLQATDERLMTMSNQNAQIQAGAMAQLAAIAENVKDITTRLRDVERWQREQGGA